ncbi:MAG: HAMP domain-containing histidine kinase [Ruminococcaceae bacterium]|nr:HAMP domain-containing histidine kinase [Oscillospiraceae bacterium]
MLKSTFSKYLAAFVLIILISFIMLSGIITSIIKNHVNEDKENELLSTSESIASGMDKIENLENGMIFQRIVITTLINIDKDMHVVITDMYGTVYLTTLTGTVNDNGLREPDISGEMGNVDISLFDIKTTDSDSKYFVHHGNLGGMLKESHVACAKEIVSNGETKGYVISLASTAKEDRLIGITRRTVINSSAWVLLAALIAVYFITERIIHPLKNMTSAAKQFAKGDFKTRVTVSGEDEVSALASAFNNMAESLENLEKMRNSFLASVSHDLRTPMTTISGFIDGITSGAIPPEKHEYYLGVISAEVHRLSRLVSQLLDVSRLESGDRKFNFTDFDVAEVCRIIIISFEQKIEDKKLDVEFNTESDSMFALADKDAIYQVLYNLCHNAIKFSSEGGMFKINLSRQSDSKIRISIFNEGQIIQKEEIPLIFERFYKSDKSRGLDKTGVGLGLYICKTIIDAHGEEIHVESGRDNGTEFSFTLKEGDSLKRKGI